MITDDQLRQIFPKLPQEKRQQFLPLLQNALTEFGITTRLRKAGFIAQIAHESGGFTRFVENLNYSAKRLRQVFPRRFPSDVIANSFGNKPEKIGNSIYANRLGNGPELSGDGFRYRGRGVIQLTGRENYRVFGKVLGLDLEGNPDLAATPEVAFRTAGAFWKSKGCNQLADIPDFRGITKKINGGFIGLAERQAIYERAKAVLQDDAAPVVSRGTTRGASSAPASAVKELDVPSNLSRGIYPGEEFSDKAAAPEGGAKKLAAKKSATKKAAKKASKKAGAKAAKRAGESPPKRPPPKRAFRKK
jgi:putative chitinase